MLWLRWLWDWGGEPIVPLPGLFTASVSSVGAMTGVVAAADDVSGSVAAFGCSATVASVRAFSGSSTATGFRGEIAPA